MTSIFYLDLYDGLGIAASPSTNQRGVLGRNKAARGDCRDERLPEPAGLCLDFPALIMFD